jgi:DNA invertase Pin-like site-specific DNA recombinase
MVDRILDEMKNKKSRTVHRKNRMKKKELTPELVHEIKSMRSKGSTYNEITKKLGVKEYQVNFALNYNVSDISTQKNVVTKSYLWGLYTYKKISYGRK